MEWEPDGPPATPGTIDKIQKKLGVVFPDDYLKRAKEFHGGFPDADVFDFPGRKEAVLESLLSFDLKDRNNILNMYDAVKDRLLPKIVPFASDPFGNLICFDYRKGATPTVVFWDHEKASQDPAKAISPICKTFTELESKLYELD